jgi:hypothetical protein
MLTARICILVLSSSLAIAQALNSGSVKPASKDAKGMNVLAQAIHATGWRREASLHDAVLTGTITRHFPDASASTTPFVMKLRGDAQYDYVESGSAHVVIKGTAGAIVGADGVARRMPAQSALSGQVLILPMSGTLLDWNAADIDVTMVGQTSINGEDCVGVQLERKHPDSDPLAATHRNAAPLTLWVSLARSLPIRADYNRLAVDNHTAKLQETAVFSDYRNVSGVVLPFRQEISFAGQLTYTYQFSDARFNTGLTDADFNVAAVAGGAQ